MRLSETLPATFTEVSPFLLANARDRINPEWIAAALDTAGVVSVRRRKLPLDVVVWHVCLARHRCEPRRGIRV